MPDRFYRCAYHRTPRDFTRLRAMGFSRDEAYMIANSAMETGLDARVLADAIYRGLYARQLALEWGLSPRTLTRVLPEWRTAEWEAAVNEPIYTREKLDVWW